MVKLVDTADLKSAAYPRGGVPVRFRSQAPVSMRLFKSCKFEKAFFIGFLVAQCPCLLIAAVRADRFQLLKGWVVQIRKSA